MRIAEPGAAVIKASTVPKSSDSRSGQRGLVLPNGSLGARQSPPPQADRLSYPKTDRNLQSNACLACATRGCLSPAAVHIK